MNLTIMTFNLRMDTPDDGKDAWPFRKEHVIQIIKNHSPDVLAIQEGLHHMICYLRDALPAYNMIGEGRDGGKSGEYNAVFYKRDVLTLKNQGQFWLSETPDIPGSISWNSGCKRICTWGNFSYSDNTSNSFYVYNTHLDNVSQNARIKGSDVITSKVKPMIQKGKAVFLMGDFNCEPDNEVIKHIEVSGLHKLRTDGKTFHEFKGGITGKQIDHIFVSEQSEIREVKIDRSHMKGSYPSDHYPVIAKLVCINEM